MAKVDLGNVVGPKGGVQVKEVLKAQKELQAKEAHKGQKVKMV